MVRLEAPLGSLARRIVEREPPALAGLHAFVDHALQLATSIPAVAGINLVLTTAGEHARDVAARVRAALPDQFGAGS